MWLAESPDWTLKRSRNLPGNNVLFVGRKTCYSDKIYRGRGGKPKTDAYILGPFPRTATIAVCSNFVHIEIFINAGDPLKYTDPDGRSETDDTIQGRAIHEMILNEYRLAHPNENVEGGYTSMSTILAEMGKIDKGQGRTDFGLKPDIWNITTGDIYEIKPMAEGMIMAKNQASLYTSLLNKLGEKAQLGHSDTLGVSGSFSYNNKIVNYSSPSSGVILYSVFAQQPKNDLVPIATGVGVTLGGIITYKIMKAVVVSIFATPAAGVASLAF